MYKVVLGFQIVYYKLEEKMHPLGQKGISELKSFNSYQITEEHSGLTVELYLKQVLHYSGRKLQKLTRKKGIKLNGKSVYLQKKIKFGDTLHVLVLEDKSYGVQPELGDIDVLYENDFLILLNKPPYQLVHPTVQTKGGTLANYLACYFQKKGLMTTIRAVHRLDRDTSGCVAFAKDSRSQFLIEQQLRAGLFKRTYLALVHGNPLPAYGTIDAPIGPHPSKANRRAVIDKGESAITHYRRVRDFGDMSLLELTLETGRTHQIRVHLAHLGHPIIGDRMYGKGSPLIKRQALHACSLNFQDFTEGHTVTIEAPLPEDFARAIELSSAK